jgi:pimeloyl-ACP methyl ester carboxylesterase
MRSGTLTSIPRPKDPVIALGLLVIALAAGCGGSDSAETGPETTTTPQTSPTGDALGEATIHGAFAVGADAHQLAMRCYGTGSPAIVLEVGTDSSGIEDFPASFVRPLAEKHMTCVYDRVGTSQGGRCRTPGICSDPPTADRRTIDEVAADLDGLLDAAAVPAPYVLVGSSGGGLVAAQFAATYPDQVAGLVLLDVGVPNPNLAEEFPGARGWRNPEHVDWVDAELRLSMLPMPVGDFPVLIVVSDESDTPDQSFWVDLSPRATQIVMHGGHDIYEDDPDGVAEQILATVEPH